MKKTAILTVLVIGLGALAVGAASHAAPTAPLVLNGTVAKASDAPLTRASIMAKKAEIEKERAAFLEQAQRQVAAFDGAIQAMNTLLEPPKPKVAEGKAAILPAPVASAAKPGK